MHRFHVIDPNSRRRAQIARMLLAEQCHTEIYENLEEFLRVTPSSGVILAIDLPAVPLVHQLEQAMIALPVVLYCERLAPERIVDAVNAGALDYMQWPFGSKATERLIARARGGGGRMTVELCRRTEALALLQRLTRREREVLELLADGESNKGIGEALGVSPRTIEIHRGNIMRKLGAASVADLVRIAIYAGLDSPAPHPPMRITAPGLVPPGQP